MTIAETFFDVFRLAMECTNPRGHERPKEMRAIHSASVGRPGATTLFYAPHLTVEILNYHIDL